MCREYRCDEPGTLEERRQSAWALRMNIHRNLSPEAVACAVGVVAKYAYLDLQVPVLGVPAGALNQFGIGEAAQLLVERGFAFLPMVRPEAVASMLAYFDGLDGQAEAGFVNWSTTQAFWCRLLFDLASDPIVLGVVERYLGAPPIVLNYSAWRSKAGAEAAGSQFFHRDFDDIKFVKLFVYLTDVVDDDGAHCFIVGSHRIDAVAALRAGWTGGVEEFDKWYFGQLRKNDADVGAVFGGDFTALIGKAGTCFLVDTSGIHKGLAPKRRDRVLAQVLYGVTPFYSPFYYELPTREARLPPPLDYVNMLWLA